MLTLAPGAKPLVQSLGFGARSCIVDNFTSSYLSLPDAGKLLPPWVYGAVVAFPTGVSTARASLLPTVPAIPGPPVPLSQASLTWTDARLPPDPGHLLQQVTTQQAIVLGSLIVAAGLTQAEDFTVPAGTQSIGFAVRSEAIPGNPGHFYDTPQSTTVQGDQTAHDYFEAVTGATNAGGPLASVFDPSDTSITVTMTANASNASKIDVLAWPTLPAVVVRQNPGDTPINVTLIVQGTNVSYDTDAGLSGTGNELGVSLFKATPAPWQAPNLRPVRISGAFPTTQATAKELIAGVAGEAIRIWDLSLVWDSASAANSLHLVDAAHGNPSGGTIFADLSQVSTTPPALRRGGPLTVGNSLYAFADGAQVARGWLSAGQA